MRWPLLVAFALSACGYRHGYYVQRQGGVEPASPMSAQPINLGQGVRGSDGSFGWRSRASNVDEAYNHAVSLAEMHGCVMYSREGEARADCGSARILVRRDRDHLYRLCVADTDRGQCAQTWATISR